MRLGASPTYPDQMAPFTLFWKVSKHASSQLDKGAQEELSQGRGSLRIGIWHKERLPPPLVIIAACNEREVGINNQAVWHKIGKSILTGGGAVEKQEGGGTLTGHTR